MTDEEIEKALKDLTSIDLSDESNYDSCGRIISPRGMSAIYEALDYINRLKAENEKLKDTLNAVENDEINLRGNLEECVDKLEHIRKDTAKELLDDLKEACPQGYLGIGLWARQEYIKYCVEVEDE